MIRQFHSINWGKKNSLSKTRVLSLGPEHLWRDHWTQLDLQSTPNRHWMQTARYLLLLHHCPKMTAIKQENWFLRKKNPKTLTCPFSGDVHSPYQHPESGMRMSGNCHDPAARHQGGDAGEGALHAPSSLWIRLLSGEPGHWWGSQQKHTFLFHLFFLLLFFFVLWIASKNFTREHGSS